jgi:hypothetical protein
LSGNIALILGRQSEGKEERLLSSIGSLVWENVSGVTSAQAGCAKVFKRQLIKGIQEFRKNLSTYISASDLALAIYFDTVFIIF